MTRYLYYPGCSMDASARAYQESLAAIAPVLGLDLAELDDWNCCGATEYFGLSRTPAYALVGRNLAIAADQADGTRTLVAPCSACFLNLARTDHAMAESPVLRRDVNASLEVGGFHYDPGAITVRHLLEVIMNEVGLARVSGAVSRPLTGLRVAPYLGCMVPRPDYASLWIRHEQPRDLDRLLATLGADVVDYPLTTECCGGHMAQISTELGFGLIRRLIVAAEARGADLMVAVCPMCQMNIDAFQGEMNRHFRTSHHMPILFFTQLMGLAFGQEPTRLGIGRELVDASRALARVGIEVPPPSEDELKAAQREEAHRRKQALPMPHLDDAPGAERQEVRR
ncbi:MAG TPA: CoB--CoM heterodisulfide reductase iron-sulfur subunit B family protein [Candidatus Limnocylindrales bacterium]